MNARWDWYQATIHGLGQDGQNAVLAGLYEHLDLSSVASSKPQNGYLHGSEVSRGGRALARVWWGGNPGVHVLATGDASPDVAAVVRRCWPRHHVTRADACIDWRDSTLFDRLQRQLIPYAVDAGITVDQRGDWARGQSRTLYLGSPASAVRLVLYEKGYEVGGDAPRDWVRLEVRLRPQKASRERVAAWAPMQAFAASRWLSEALERIGWDRLPAQSIGTVYRPPDQARARAALLRQYGRILDQWIEDAGTPDAFVAELRRESAALDVSGR